MYKSHYTYMSVMSVRNLVPNCKLYIIKNSFMVLFIVFYLIKSRNPAQKFIIVLTLLIQHDN